MHDRFIACGLNFCDMAWLLLFLLLCLSVFVCICERYVFHTIMVFSHLCFNLWDLEFQSFGVASKGEGVNKKVNTVPKFKGILGPIFYIDINIHIDRKRKIMQNLFKKTIFSKCLSFYWPYYPRYFIYSDGMWHHVCTTCNSLIST